jgi:hypothetical protein
MDASECFDKNNEIAIVASIQGAIERDRFRAARRHDDARWMLSQWSIRLWSSLFYLVFFYAWYVTTFVFFPEPRSPDSNAFWTEPNLGGFSLLAILTTVQFGWASISALECVFCWCDKSAPYRSTRIGLNAGILVLLLSYAILVRMIARTFITIGPI